MRGQQVEDRAGPQRRPVVERQRHDIVAYAMPMLEHGRVHYARRCVEA
jgi:hypothetical protein